ncbi:MAG: alpha/beta fold hydrolase [Burkholderiales bacterium]
MSDRTTLSVQPDVPGDDGELLSIVASDGTLLAARVFPNPQATSRMVVSHGNGLATFGYRVFWEALRANFEIVTFDVRSHGLSEAGPSENHHWPQFVTDLESLWDTLKLRLGERHTVGVFHSLSAVTSLLHLHRYGARWDALALFDPPLPVPAGHRLDAPHLMEVEALAERALRRRRSYDSPRDLAERFGRSAVFGAWREPAPLDMARATLRRDAASEAWVLNCAPEREAFIYRNNLGRTAWDVLAAPPCPIHLIASDPNRPGAEVPSFASLCAHQEAGVSYEAIAGTGHFLQLEQPEQCRCALLKFLAASQ